MSLPALPDGSYTLTGTADGEITVPTGPTAIAAGFCAFSTTGGTTTLHQGESDWNLSQYDAGDTFKATYPLIGDLTVANGPAALALYCDNVDSGSPTADFFGALIATRIGTLH